MKRELKESIIFFYVAKTIHSCSPNPYEEGTERYKGKRFINKFVALQPKSL